MGNDTELPIGFKNWLQLYRHLKKNGYFNEREVIFSTLTQSYFDLNEKVRTYNFDIDYIKARCFDELTVPKFRVSDYEQMLIGLINGRNVQRGDELDTKIKQAIEDLYNMGEYD